MVFSLKIHHIRDQEYFSTVKGLEIQVNELVIFKVSSLPIGYIGIRKTNNWLLMLGNYSFSTMKKWKKKNGLKRESLPEPWDEIEYRLLKYITCEGRLSMGNPYHFRILH